MNIISPRHGGKLPHAARAVGFLIAAALAAFGQGGPTAPIEIQWPAAGINWQMHGLGQPRFSNPASRKFDLPFAELSVLGSAGERTTVFVRGGMSTVDSGELFLLEARASYQVSKSVNIQAGRVLLPFSRQFYSPPSSLMFAGLSSADTVFNAPYAWGALASLKRGSSTLTFGAVSGPTPLDNLGHASPAGRPGLIGRLDWNLLGPFGFLESDPTMPDTPQLTLGVAGMISDSAFDSPLQNLSRGDRNRSVTGDAGFRLNRFTAQTAVYRRSVSRSLAGDRGDWGGYLQSGFYLIPRRLEMAGRLGAMSFGKTPYVSAGPSFGERALGLNCYLRGHFIKMQADYTWYRARSVADFTPHGQFRVQAQFAF